MPRLGELEREVMASLWAATEPLTAREVQAALIRSDLAATTILTVLSRLQRKGLVTRERTGRAYRYCAVGTCDDHVVGLMRDALDTTSDRDAALARFLDGMSHADRGAFRDALMPHPDRGLGVRERKG